MKVDHHPELPHKNIFKEYLPEFLMIFAQSINILTLAIKKRGEIKVNTKKMREVNLVLD